MLSWTLEPVPHSPASGNRSNFASTFSQPSDWAEFYGQCSNYTAEAPKLNHQNKISQRKIVEIYSVTEKQDKDF